jgi:uncharacterized protein (DUF362 family)
MPKVSIVKGPGSPDSAAVFGMVRRAVGLVGGMSVIVDESDTVALKPNIVTGRLSGQGVTTNPRVVEALIKLALEAGARRILVVEGSGYGSPTGEAFVLSGIREAAERNGAEVVDVDEDELVEVEVPDPLVLRRVSVSKRFYEADVRVNVPVMKTHDQMLMTLGMKNLKGVIPKPQKRLFHRVGLAKAVLDLNKAVPVDLTVVDAVHAMEGLGPSFGDIVEMGVVMASTDVYSLDVVGSRVMGFSPMEVEYLKLASEQGLVSLEGAGIEVVGDDIGTVSRAFKRPPIELKPQKGVTIIEKGACSACRGTIRSVFYDLEQMGLLAEVRDLIIVVGPQAEMPQSLGRRPLVMGTCLRGLEGEGRYVLGCPPNNDKMIEAIKKLCNL